MDIVRCFISKMSVPSMGLPCSPSYSLATSCSFPRSEMARAKNIMYFHLMPRLSGTVPLLPLYAFMTCMWTILPLPVHFTVTAEVLNFPI